ncbi:MAG: MAPEG family protein [Oligoflexales bacterium]
MIALLLYLLILIVAQTFVAPCLRYIHSGLSFREILHIGLGSRDQMPPMSIFCERAARAQKNMQEAIPILLSLFFLCIILKIDSQQAQDSASLILVSRLLYIPAYISGLKGLRSFFWVTSWIGIAIMLSCIIAHI